MAEAQKDREQLQHSLVLASRTASVSGSCSLVQEAGDSWRFDVFSEPPKRAIHFLETGHPTLTTGPRLIYSNNATDMTYRDAGTRPTGTSHMMFEWEEHTLRPAMNNNMNQHLTGRHSEGAGRDATGT